MAQMMQTHSEAPHDDLSLEARHVRLQKLVGELLQTNQDLRFKVAQLEQRAERVTCALDEASAIYGLLMP